MASPYADTFEDQPFSALPSVSVTDLPSFSAGPSGPAPVAWGWNDGDKFWGGYGPTVLQVTDYWTLRARSAELFETNLYARGLIRRLVTNEINTGLFPEPAPVESVLGMADGKLNEWAEEVENRFLLWANTPWLCDWTEQASFGELQQLARMEALIDGDVLCVLRVSQQTGLPMIQLFRGSCVQSPIDEGGRNIKHGVELDERGRHAAYWVQQEDGTTRRLPAWGEKSGRRLAWLLYGTEKRLDDVRGTPLLGLILQSLKEVDRYRDAVQRKAVINSILALFIKKTQDKPGTLPMQAGAVRRDSVSVTDNVTPNRSLDVAKFAPGLVVQELQVGEEPVGFGTQGIDLAFGPFEEAMIQAIAWANEIPPEILRLAFSNNYSASQAAINEFKIYLNRIRETFGKQMCHPVFCEWILAETMAGKIVAPGLLESWRDMSRHDEFTAWTACEWSGAIKPSTDIRKQAQGYKELNAEGWITNDRASRELTGTNFNKNIKRLKRENEMKVEAMRPIAEFKKEFGMDLSQMSSADVEAAVREAIEDVAT